MWGRLRAAETLDSIRSAVAARRWRSGSSWRRLPANALATVMALATAGLAAAGLAACAGTAASALPAQTHVSPKARAAGGRPRHIAVIVMENEEYGDIVGSRSAPYISSLARRYGLASQMYAITHPSLPNYLALTGGSTFGIASDCTDCIVHELGLADQLSAAHISFKAYMEDLPRPCFTGSGAGLYAKRHDPFVYYRSVTGDPTKCSHVVPLTELVADERHHELPAFLWITPNVCHDMHDCAVATGDRFLAATVPPLLRALGPRGLLFLTWDEGSSDAGCCRLAAGGHIATIVAGGDARPHARLSTPTDHYSVLATIEDLLGLPRLRGAACRCTPTLSGLVAPARR